MSDNGTYTVRLSVSLATSKVIYTHTMQLNNISETAVHCTVHCVQLSTEMLITVQLCWSVSYIERVPLQYTV